jgi:carotenoid cleavage dioxygenase-like enzyme
MQSAPADKANSSIMTRGAWTQSEGGLLGNLFKLPTNPANTSAVWWAGKLLALCEGGMPVEVDPDTLQTKGEVDFGTSHLAYPVFKLCVSSLSRFRVLGEPQP